MTLIIRERTSAKGVKVFRGPRGTVYSCPHCKHHELVAKGPGEGRGHGLRTGGAAHSRMVAHMRLQHPDKATT